MRQLYLTIFSDCLENIDDYLLNDDNLKEFINRLGAICFHDFCTFYYTANQQRKIIDTLKDLGVLDYQTFF